MEADFVKLFGALRKIHGNVTNTNNSAIRQGLLARGYAQLNALTRHHYSSSEEVFAARAMLFAERMVSQADTLDAKLEALWHRAYVLSIVGLDGLGWSDLEQIREMQGGPRGSPHRCLQLAFANPNTRANGALRFKPKPAYPLETVLDTNGTAD